MRYDDALPTLVAAAQDLGIDLSKGDSLVLRDAVGRLGIAFSERQSKDTLAKRLRACLGPYALAEPVLPTLIFASLQEAGSREVAVALGGGEFAWIRLVDRRIVGSDWLADLAPPAAGPPRLVFGAVKGGVGRTTALAVTAADLARHGKRCLCIDLDLEAPGLSSMLLRSTVGDDRRPKYGVLDYLIESRLGGITDEELVDFLGVSHFADGLIHVLPAAGRTSDEHPENLIGKLARGLIETVTSSERYSVLKQIQQMVDRFVAYGDFDVVLVDSRAGLAELTAAAWLGMGARKVLMFGANQPQMFQDYRYLLAHLVGNLGVPDAIEADDWRTRLAFVQSKAPSAATKRDRFRERLHTLCADTLYDAEDDAEHSPFNFAFDERGDDVPHDACYIGYHPDYDACSPVDDETVVQEEVYWGPFGDFLVRAWRFLGWDRPK